MRRRTRVLLLRAALPACAVLFASSEVEAHTGVEGLGDLWNGSLHLLLDPTQGLTLVALGLGMARVATSGGKTPFTAYHAGLGAGLLCGLLLLPPGAEVLAPLPLAAAGLVLVDPGGRLTARPGPVFGGAALLAGLAFGSGIPIEVQRFLFAAGMGLGAILLPLYPVVLWERFHRPWFAIAVRIVGSWLTAIAIILLGSALRSP